MHSQRLQSTSIQNIKQETTHLFYLGLEHKARGNTVKQVSPLMLSVPEGYDAPSARHRVKNQARMTPFLCLSQCGEQKLMTDQVTSEKMATASALRNEVKQCKAPGDKCPNSKLTFYALTCLCVINIDNTALYFLSLCI